MLPVLIAAALGGPHALAVAALHFAAAAGAVCGVRLAASCFDGGEPSARPLRIDPATVRPLGGRTGVFLPRPGLHHTNSVRPL